MIKKNHPINDKEEEKILAKTIKRIVKAIGEKNIHYCICGSWIKYNECCKIKKIEDSWFMDIKFKQFLWENEYIISRKDETEKEKFKPLIKKWLYQELEKYWRLKCNCIGPCCKNEHIRSHLIPKNFIKTLQKQSYKFEIDWIDKKLWADSFAIKLWCQFHDWNLFKETDKIWDIADLFDTFDEGSKNPDRDNLLWEFFFKTLSFKVKTLILDQMYWFLWMLLSAPQSKEFKKKVFKKFLDNYSKYNTILTYFDSLFIINDWKKTISIPYLVGKSGKVTNIFDKWKIYYQSNIKLIWNVPLFINSIVKNWDWIYFLWTTVLHWIDKIWKETLEKIYEDILKYKDSKNYSWALDYFNNFLYDENIYYLNMDKGFFWDTYIYWKK